MSLLWRHPCSVLFVKSVLTKKIVTDMLWLASLPRTVVHRIVRAVASFLAVPVSDAPNDAAARSLSDVILEKDAYDADFLVSDRAQVLTREIVRIGLLAIASVGFLLAHPAQKESPHLGPRLL